MVFVIPALLLSKVHAYIELVGNPHAVHAHCTFAILHVRHIQVLGQHDMALEKQESQLSYFSCPMRVDGVCLNCFQGCTNACLLWAYQWVAN